MCLIFDNKHSLLVPADEIHSPLYSLKKLGSLADNLGRMLRTLGFHHSHYAHRVLGVVLPRHWHIHLDSPITKLKLCLRALVLSDGPFSSLLTTVGQPNHFKVLVTCWVQFG